MAHLNRPHHPRAPIAAAAALLLAAQPSWAQSSNTAATTQLEPVTVTGRAELPASIAGWGDTPLAKTPLQASVYGAEQLKDGGVQRLSDLTAYDAAVSDAYNAEGYWDFLTVRGFVLDNRYNFRRDGLPINAETSIPLDNKARIEILKGTSGMQAGTSAPGGLVNYVVKRPLDEPLRTASLEWVQPGTLTGTVDLSQRFGPDRAFGVRINAAAAHLDPMVRDSTGKRNLFALAADWRVGPDTLLEAEIETSHRRQPSQPGFSMLGNVVPPPGDPRINLNDQPWSLPVIFDATTASLRWQQKLGADWRLSAHAATQRLRTDDRLAYPFGCSKEGNFDRYCSDGSFDYYDYHSDNEHRDTDALQIAVDGKAATGALTHTLGFGVLQSRFKSRLQDRVDDGKIVGTGTVDGRTMVPTLPALGTVANTNRTERTTELYARDAVAIGERTTAWLGLRHTRLNRDSIDTDGAEPTHYVQSFTTPWVALSHAYARDQLVYASWGEGVESTVAPNRAIYTNAGQALPALKSRQTEIGIKGTSAAFDWNVAAFDIRQPQNTSTGSCDNDANCTLTLVLDGWERHRGIELGAGWSGGPWTLHGGLQWLRARREGSQSAAIDGLRPTNVPAFTAKLQSAYEVAALPGLALQANVAYEGKRMVLPDNSASIPGYARLDAGLRYATRTAGTRTTWRAGIDNLFDKRAWRESPFEFGHVYLYPLAPRTLRASVQVDL